MPVLELSARYFDRIEASFIWGYPFETMADFEQTYDLAAEASLLAPAVNVQLHMLSPLPLSPIYREFDGRLLEPEHEDAQWLLLPALLLDKRAETLRAIVRAAPDIYPGFYSFPTPAKEAKRERLEQTMRALHRLIGSALYDQRVAGLMAHEDREVEQALLAGASSKSELVGTGLAVGFFKRNRRNAGEAAPLEGARGARITRERPELRQVVS